MFAAGWQQSRQCVFEPEAHRTGLVGDVRFTRTLCTLPLRVGMTPLLLAAHLKKPLVQGAGRVMFRASYRS